MALVPSGKIRKMVAQSYGNPLAEGYSTDSISERDRGQPELDTQGAGQPEFDTQGAMDDAVSAGQPDSAMDSSAGGDGAVGTVDPGKPKRRTLSGYVFEKLESYGYPGRRLQEFKSKFVRESVSPEGVKDIQVEIPDKKYPGPEGVADTIENEDLREIASEVNQMFHLNFNGAERSDGKWTIKFTSETINNPENEVVHDNLDQVYGKPAGNGQPVGSQKAACPSLPEMIKMAKIDMVSELMRAKSKTEKKGS
jgi:hypothetical protein